MNTKTVDSRPSIALCTLGQEGHGKTALTAAILQVLAKTGDATPFTYEQLLPPPASMSHACGGPEFTHVEYTTRSRRYLHADPARHADGVEHLIMGRPRLDAALLVVSATAGPMPQTREHLLLARQVGVPALVVFLNKMDLLDEPELRGLVEREVRELLTASGYPGDTLPVIPGSALKALEGDTSALGEGSIMKLLEAMDKHLPTLPLAVDGPLLMPVEGVFFPAGREPAITGRIERGVLRPGEEVEVVGLRPARRLVVTGLETFRQQLHEGRAGVHLGARVRGLERGDVVPGQVLARPGSLTAHTRFLARLLARTDIPRGQHEPLRAGYWPEFLLVHLDVTAGVKLPDSVEKVARGEHVLAEVELSAPMALEKGLGFVLYGGQRLLYRGVVVDLLR